MQAETGIGKADRRSGGGRSSTSKVKNNLEQHEQAVSDQTFSVMLQAERREN